MLFLLLILFSVTGLAQQPLFIHFQIKDGLPSSEVYDVMQDSKGYLWFGTDKGISRYDGYSFRNYSSEKGLPDNTVFGFYEDHKGRIWLRSMSGRLAYYLNDSIYEIGASQRINQLLRGSIITSLYLDKGDTLWCGITSGQGYYRIAPPYRAQDFTYVKYKGRFTYIVEIDSVGFIWGYTVYDPSLKQLNDSSKNFFFHPMAKEPFKHYEGLGLAPNSSPLRLKDETYILLQTNKLIKGTPRGTVIVHTKANNIKLLMDNNERLWVGSMKKGVSVYPKGDISYPNPEHYLDELSVSGMIMDSEGGYWFSTLEDGVFYLPSLRIQFFDKSTGLLSNKISSVQRKNSSEIWASTSTGDIEIISPTRITHLKDICKLPASNSVYTITQGEDSSNFLVGSQHAFNLRITKEDHKPEKISAKTVLEPPFAIKCFGIGKGDTYYGGNYLSLFQLGFKHEIRKEVRTPSKILCMQVAPDNTLWIGCINGLWKYRDGSFRYMGDSIPLFKNRIDDMKIGPDGTWWFATRGKGVLYLKGKSIEQISEKEGLSSNAVNSIFITPRKIIWAAGNKGLDKLQFRSDTGYTVTHYSTADGLPSDEINQVIQNGKLVWVATAHGLAYFNADEPDDILPPPPVYLTGLTLNFKDTKLVRGLRLRHDQNYLLFRYTGITYRNHPALRYKYKLEGLDTTWHYTTTAFVEYTTLPPGDYTFLVYAINASNTQSKTPASFPFHIAKPFWLEFWFLGLSLITLIAIGLLIYYQRVRVLKKRMDEKMLINKRIAEIELKALRSQMNPHFIFNCLASIQHFIMKNENELADEYLFKFSRLIRNVLNNSRSEYISLETEIQTLDLYLQMEKMRFTSRFDYHLTISPELAPEKIFIPPMLVQPYAENAIWHGLMHLSDKKAELMIRFEKSGETVLCTVEDNGIGRVESMKLKKTKAYESLGLSITNERVNTMNSIYKSRLKVALTDKYDPDGQPGGTLVEIWMPITNELIHS